MNKPRIKGTRFETEVKRKLDIPGLVRCPANSPWDLELQGENPIEALATRPDRGQTLITIPLETFAALWDAYHRNTKRLVDPKVKPEEKVYEGTPGLRIECKRTARPFAHHTIYEETFRG